MAKKKLKPLLPSLKEKKRYLAFKVNSEKKLGEFKLVYTSLRQNILGFMGEFLAGKAGVWFLPELWDAKKQIGIVQVNSDHVDHLRTAIALTPEINKQEVLVQTIGVSGTIKKAKSKFMNAS